MSATPSSTTSTAIAATKAMLNDTPVYASPSDEGAEGSVVAPTTPDVVLGMLLLVGRTSIDVIGGAG